MVVRQLREEVADGPAPRSGSAGTNTSGSAVRLASGGPARDAWPLDETVVHLNHGSFGAVPTEVLRRQEELRRQADLSPVGWFPRQPELVAAARREVAPFVGAAAPRTRRFVPNASGGGDRRAQQPCGWSRATRSSSPTTGTARSPWALAGWPAASAPGCARSPIPLAASRRRGRRALPGGAHRRRAPRRRRPDHLADRPPAPDRADRRGRARARRPRTGGRRACPRPRGGRRGRRGRRLVVRQPAQVALRRRAAARACCVEPQAARPRASCGRSSTRGAPTSPTPSGSTRRAPSTRPPTSRRPTPSTSSSASTAGHGRARP